MPEELLKLFDKYFYYIGKGEECPYFDWAHFDEDDMFWVIPMSSYFVMYGRFYGGIKFYKICPTKQDLPPNHIDVIRKTTMDWDSLDSQYCVEAYFAQIRADIIIEKFGKRYNFLLYELDLLK